jgi:hypothetical protein
MQSRADNPASSLGRPSETRRQLLAVQAEELIPDRLAPGGRLAEADPASRFRLQPAAHVVTVLWPVLPKFSPN